MIVIGLTHIGLSVFCAYIFSLILGHLNSTISIISLSLGLMISIWIYNKTKTSFTDLSFNHFREGFAGKLEKLLFFITSLLVLRHFTYLLFQVDHEFKTLHPNNLGDLPLHINFIKNISQGASFLPMNPIFSNEVLRYPFGMDLYNALWDTLGVPLTAHLMLVGLFCSYALVVLLRELGSWLAICGFFLSGGFISSSRLEGPHADTNMLISWKNLFTSIWITQRGFLWALPVGLLLIYLLKKETKQILLKNSFLFQFILLLFCLLSFFHLHSFLILFLMGSTYLAYLVVVQKSYTFKTILNLFLKNSFLALIPVYFILISTNFFKASQIVHFSWGWTFGSDQSFLQYLLVNFGAYLILFMGIAILLLLTSQKKFWPSYLFNLGFFILFFNLMLAPYDWDNIKILIWPYLGFCFLAYEIIDSSWSPFVQSVILICLSWGGWISIYPSQFTNSTYTSLWKTENIANAKSVTQNISADTVFSAASSYDHELTFLGFKRLLGYEGHTWSHGIDSQKVRKLQKLLLSHPDQFLLDYHKDHGLEKISDQEIWIRSMKELGVEYIYWGPREKAEFGDVSAHIWKSFLKKQSTQADIEVYSLN